ncbi:uncharacterized protein LOC125087977 isoform X2 [Lutra lutra]|uniref:uncharacterized protein LOC125087977 isoform X2 n=1 Tax=Lutra lutra TaxID=9657 RepID=UPI001FD497CC|nr:uncharacterized protein LOC125087977 isoform X2 [Lutra lutra]
MLGALLRWCGQEAGDTVFVRGARDCLYCPEKSQRGHIVLDGICTETLSCPLPWPCLPPWPARMRTAKELLDSSGPGVRESCRLETPGIGGTEQSALDGMESRARTGQK